MLNNVKLSKMEKEINEVLSEWAFQPIADIISDVAPLIHLYSVTGPDGIAARDIDKEDRGNVVLLRTVYLLSKLAERHAGKLATLKCKFPDLWLRMEKNTESLEEHYIDESEKIVCSA